MSKSHHYMDEPVHHVRQARPFHLGKFLYNAQEGTVMNRDRTSWAKIGIFYFIFYGVLAALVAICMWVFHQTLDLTEPKWKLEESIIGTNPGLGFRPLPPEENVESTLIWYKGTQLENYKYWTDSLNEFLEVYKVPGLKPGRGENIFNCDYNKPPPPGHVCDVDIKSWDPCTKENNYSYHKSAPCVFLKLNKIFGWIPEFYNTTTQLPAKMPENLKTYISEIEKADAKKMNTIWVSCEGENPADQENIGPVDYHPMRGFPGFFYPYTNAKGYLSPLVAVHFQRPKRGIIINVECKAWAKNIRYDRKERMGSVHFELLID